MSFAMLTHIGGCRVSHPGTQIFPRRKFFDAVIPEFKKRFEALPIPLPVSARILAQDYLQQRTASACPTCLFASVRREQLAAFPDVNIPSWNVA